MTPDFEKWFNNKYPNSNFAIGGFLRTDINGTMIVNEFTQDYAKQEYNRGYKEGFKDGVESTGKEYEK